MDSVAIVIAGVVGLCFGSFATSLAWRIPRGLSWIKSRSCCTSCGAQLIVRDLVPVLSWLVARGRCRHCGVSISKRYPVTELTLAALFALAAWRSPGIEIFLPVAMLAFALTLMTLIDWERRVLPDGLNLIIAGLALFFVAPDLARIGPALITAMLLAGIGWGLRAYIGWRLKREALGLGDVKFMAAAGLWLTPQLMPAFLVLAGLGGIGLYGIIGRGGRAFAFGPALAFALMMCVLFAGPLSVG